MDNLDDFCTYDEHLHEPLEDRGWEVTPVPWRSDADWNSFEAVIIRSPWDYHHHHESFVTVLKDIEASDAELFNSLDLIKWNIDKTYLEDLADRGISTVPTRYSENFTAGDLKFHFKHFDTEELIIKPRIGAGSASTYRVDYSETGTELEEQLAERFGKSPLMVQPFQTEVIKTGEYSLIYFCGDFSHGLLKRPKEGDFRVQEEFGGHLKRIYPDGPMTAFGRRVLQTLSRAPLYARVDFIEQGGAFRLMEFELIEPSLYFNLAPERAETFADYFCQSMKQTA